MNGKPQLMHQSYLIEYKATWNAAKFPHDTRLYPPTPT